MAERLNWTEWNVVLFLLCHAPLQDAASSNMGVGLSDKTARLSRVILSRRGRTQDITSFLPQTHLPVEGDLEKNRAVLGVAQHSLSHTHTPPTFMTLATPWLSFFSFDMGIPDILKWCSRTIWQWRSIFRLNTCQPMHVSCTWVATDIIIYQQEKWFWVS